MTADFKTKAPADNADFRASLYQGDIYILPANDASAALAEHLRRTVEAVVPQPQQAHRLENFLPLYKRLKSEIAQKDYARELLRDPLSVCGFTASELKRDFLRLRFALHEGHYNEAAKSAYSIHRDTWYANPQHQINLWMPLHDMRPGQGFTFYPGYFAQAVKNTSAVFDYADWRENVGFGVTRRPASDDLYPAATEDIPDSAGLSFECGAGDLVIFSAAHLHGNCRNLSGLSRISVDVRFVHEGDRGAPNVDNASQGNAAQDYFPL